MRYYLVLLFFWVAACRPAGQRTSQTDSTMVYVKMNIDGDCRICRKPLSGFRHAFYEFYVDDSDSLYIKSFLLKPDSSGKLVESDVMVNLPRLDSATLHSEGLYLIDKNKVICMFGNSDGGNCEGYFRDGGPLNYMGDRTTDEKIPKDYVFVE